MVEITLKNKKDGKLFKKYFLNEFWGIKFMKKIKRSDTLEVVGKMSKISKNDIIGKR
jgi:hypothetical protein